jgi:hypothetical protein
MFIDFVAVAVAVGEPSRVQSALWTKCASEKPG